MLVVKPSEWPSLATKTGRFIRLARTRLAPILLEVKDISRSIMEEGRPAEPDDWTPLPQPYQKGGEF
ncbi:twin-arginine translocation protein (TatA/E), partial [mine drainage metagenome]